MSAWARPGITVPAAPPFVLIDGTSQRVALEATKFSLATAGIKPAADNVSLNIGLEIRTGYVVDLSEPDQPAAKIVGGVVDAPPAKVIDAEPIDTNWPVAA